MHKRLAICLLICCSAFSVLGQNVLPAQNNTLVPVDRDLFISKQNGIYGIGDSSHHWLNNTPTGDTIFHIKDWLFAVRGADRLYTICDERFEPHYVKVSEIKESGRYVFFKNSDGWTVLLSNADSDELLGPTYDSIRITGSYTLLYKNGKQGLLKTNGPWEDFVPAQYDKVGLYYEGVLLINHGKLGWKGDFYVPVEYDHIYKERSDILAAQNASGTTYYSDRSGGPLLAEPTDSIVFYDQYYKRVRGKQQSIFRIQDNSLVTEITGDELHPFSFANSHSNTDYCVIGRDSACALYRNGKVLTEFKYQNVLPESSIRPPYFRVVQNSGVGVILENGDVQLAADYTDILNQIGNYYIVRRGYKLGLVTKGDTVLLPCEYSNITFCDDTYIYLSKDGTLFGLYNYVKRQEISPYKYREFRIDTAFIVARQMATSDVYYKDEPVLLDVYDAEANRNTVKGYKNGKIYVGSVRKGAWESYEYEIPSYKIKVTDEYRDYLESSWLPDVVDTYDYASGKWGRFSYTSGKWAGAPLAHGGNNPGGFRLLDFPVDSSITWQGIDFHLRKKVAPMQIAWNRKSKFNWIDAQSYVYTSNDLERTLLTVSPICYTEPGAGKCLNHFNPVTINTGFMSSANKSVLAESGRVNVGNYGQISLSTFITQMSASGNVHPASLKDYETLIDPAMFVSISGSTEHILHRSSRVKHISVQNSFEWVDTEHLNPVIFRAAGKYGLLSDTGTYLLKPEYESLMPIGASGSAYLAGVRSNSYRIYYPENNTYSKEIAQLLSFKGPYLLIKADSLRMAVIDHQLDTLLVNAGSISLLEDSGYVLKKDGISTIYKNRKILFSHSCDITEKINEGHYLISNSAGNYILSAKGDTIYQSKRHIKYVSLGNNYILDSGEGRTVFDLSDKAVCRFGKEPYLVTAQQHLLVKEKESVVLLKKNGTSDVRINGRFTRATKLYVVSKTAKTKNVFDYSGKPLVTKAIKVKVINDRYFSYQLGKKFMLYDVLTGEKKRIERLSVNITKEGLEYDDSGEEEDSTEVVETIEDMYSVVNYRGKYGLKKEEKLILPYSFFHIQKASDVFLVQDKIEYKLYDLLSNKFLTNDAYEKVYPYKYYFQVFREGKLYYINR